jgi:hypothetical protein
MKCNKNIRKRDEWIRFLPVKTHDWHGLALGAAAKKSS